MMISIQECFIIKKERRRPTNLEGTEKQLLNNNHTYMDSKVSKLHVVMFPWLAFGHMIPFLELAKLMAQKGHRVSFVSTPRNIIRLPKIPPNLLSQINFVEFPLPRVHDLPENAEATIDITINKHPYLKKAFDAIQEPMTRFLETSDPDWVIYDLAYWLCPIATKLGISCACFSIFTGWSVSMIGSSLLSSSSSGVMDGQDTYPREEHGQFTVSSDCMPFSTNVVLRIHEAQKTVNWVEENFSDDSDISRFRSSIRGCDVFVVRSCLEFEAYWLNHFREVHRRPVLPLGLLPPTVQDSRDDISDIFLPINEFLHKHEKGSVVYIALGSEVRPSQSVFTELALGLELSGLPFFWALRKQSNLEECDSIELPDGFEERVKGRGLVWTSWAPQLKILAHDSVGGFLTHCGWSSIIEGLQLGRALIMLPLWGDQGLNAKVMEENEVGVIIPRDGEQYESFTRKSIAESLRLIMVDEEGKIYREKANEMKNIFGDKRRHDQYVDDFVEYLKKHRNMLRAHCPSS